MGSNRHALTGTATLVALLLGTAAAQAAPEYSIQDLGTLPGDDMADIWNGNFINNDGDVALSSYDEYYVDDKACLWTEATGLVQLPVPAGTAWSQPFGLNDRHQVVGILAGTDGIQRGARWDASGCMLLPVPTGWSSWANDINNRGDVAGAMVDLGGQQHATIWRKGQIPMELPRLQGTDSCAAMSINNAGEAVGWCAAPDGWRPVAWNRGGVRALPIEPGGFGMAVGIDENGDIVGTSGPHALLWSRDGATDMTPDADWAFPGSSNAKGQAVLVAGGATWGGAYLWEDGALTDLHELIPSDAGWSIWYAFGINAAGQISGVGEHDGHAHVFLMTPLE